MTHLPPCVLWIDPGGMTGLASLVGGVTFTAVEYPFKEACDRVWGLCSGYRQDLWIGWEKFTINSQTHKKTRQPDAYEVPGVVRWQALCWGCRILTPANPDDRRVATREKLQALGWWVPGKDDAQSAAQHLLAWCLRTQSLPPREVAALAAARS